MLGSALMAKAYDHRLRPCRV